MSWGAKRRRQSPLRVRREGLAPRRTHKGSDISSSPLETKACSPDCTMTPAASVGLHLSMISAHLVLPPRRNVATSPDMRSAAMLLPVRGRFRVCVDGYDWTDAPSGKRRFAERSVPPWQTMLEDTNMAVEIANVSLDEDIGIRAFLDRWGVPIIKDETTAASMSVDDMCDLVRSVRDAIASAARGDEETFKLQFGRNAFFAARPRSDSSNKPSMFVECRDPAATAWLQLAQRERIDVKYCSCERCGAYFTLGGAERNQNSRRYCSRCRELTASGTK